MSRFLVYVVPATNLLLLFLPYVDYPKGGSDEWYHDAYETPAWRELAETASDPMGGGHPGFAIVLAVAFFFPSIVIMQIRSARAQLCANTGAILQFQLVTSWRIFFGLQAVVVLFGCWLHFIIVYCHFHFPGDGYCTHGKPAVAAIVHFALVLAAAVASFAMAFSSILSKYSQHGCQACAMGDAPLHRRKPAIS